MRVTTILGALLLGSPAALALAGDSRGTTGLVSHKARSSKEPPPPSPPETYQENPAAPVADAGPAAWSCVP